MHYTPHDQGEEISRASESVTKGVDTPLGLEGRSKALPTVEMVMARSSGENFPVAMRVLPLRYRRYLQGIYGFARLIDYIGDELPWSVSERLTLLHLLKEEVAISFARTLPEQADPFSFTSLRPLRSELLEKETAVRSILNEAWLVKEAKGLDIELFVKLIEANIQDQVVLKYSNFEDLLGYCDLSANPIGRMVLAVFDVTDPRANHLSDAVCTALQIIEHLQDVREDALNGRIYLPKEDMELFSVKEDELIGLASSPSLRALVAHEAKQAAQLLDAGSELVGMLNGWAKVAVAGFVAGGLAALDAIRDAGNDVLAESCKPTRATISKHMVRLILTTSFHLSSMKDEAPKTTPFSGTADASEKVVADVNLGVAESLPLVEGSRTPSSPTLADAYRVCLALTAEQARNFYYGIRLLDPDRRAAMAALYAMARRIDDVVDCSDEVEVKLTRIKEIRHSLTTLSVDSPDPLQAALADVLQRYPLPVAALFELVDGCEADALGKRYDSFDELVGYCRLVAGSVGRLTIGVLGVSEPELGTRLADSLGIGLQLVNILRDVVIDKEELGRVYLPVDDLRRFGCSPDLLEPTLALERVISLEAARARFYIDEGLGVLSLLDARSRACVAAMAGIYERLLSMVEKDPSIVLRGRLHLSPWRKAVVAGQSLLGAIL